MNRIFFGVSAGIHKETRFSNYKILISPASFVFLKQARLTIKKFEIERFNEEIPCLTTADFFHS
ncbi:hypothetical protein SAMN03080615_00587 [Amphritea atlantica]|uniref:Uncharacterized protein n=1 Tax=Amphritea atlantica TaxID=355243 RepID=A0A1H9DJH0_9GAMM|nr:hypothetical protein SAMN03080615_00587 [Amphritea atlantica]